MYAYQNFHFHFKPKWFYDGISKFVFIFYRFHIIPQNKKLECHHKYIQITDTAIVKTISIYF